MMILRQVARTNTSPLAVSDWSRLSRSEILVRRVILRCGIGIVRLLILHLLLILVSGWSSIGKVCWLGNTWRPDVVGTTVLARDGG